MLIKKTSIKTNKMKQVLTNDVETSTINYKDIDFDNQTIIAVDEEDLTTPLYVLVWMGNGQREFVWIDLKYLTMPPEYNSYEQKIRRDLQLILSYMEEDYTIMCVDDKDISLKIKIK